MHHRSGDTLNLNCFQIFLLIISSHRPQICWPDFIEASKGKEKVKCVLSPSHPELLASPLKFSVSYYFLMYLLEIKNILILNLHMQACISAYCYFNMKCPPEVPVLNA
jgi:hypothetical protein